MKEKKMNRLSFGQKDIWYYQRINKESFAYNVPMAYLISGKVIVDKLIKAINIVIKKHPILKTKFFRYNDEVVQEIDPKINLFAEKEYIDRPYDDSEKIAIIEESRRVFALEEGAIARFKVKIYNDNTKILYINIHHIVFDGLSIPVVLHEIKEYYKKILNNEKYSVKEENLFDKYLENEKNIIENDKVAFEYWSNEIEKHEKVIKKDKRKSTENYSYKRGVISYEVCGTMKEAVDRITEKYKISNYVFYLGIYGLLMSQCKKESQIIVNFPFMNRLDHKYVDVVGHFINMVPIIIDVDHSMIWSDYINKIKEKVFEVLKYAYYPVQQILKSHKIEFDNDTVMYYQNWTGTLEHINEGGDIKFIHLPEVFQEGEFDKVFEIIEHKQKNIIKIRFNENVYGQQSEELLAEKYINLIENVVNCPEKSLSEILDNDIKMVIERINDTYSPYDYDLRICDYIYIKANQNKDKIAIICENKKITYGELIEKSDKVVSNLIKRGVKSGDKIGVLMPRSIDLVVFLIAIMKADAIYIPIDEMYPVERIKYMIDNSNMNYLISASSERQNSMFLNDTVILLSPDEILNYTEDNTLKTSHKNEIAYILYTSGSTGNPKGVQIYHKSLTNALRAFSVKPGFSENDILYSVTTICFDIAELELFLPLINGGTLELATQKTISNINLLRDTIMKSDANVLQATPAFFKSLGADVFVNKKMRILCGGEAMGYELASMLLNAGVELWNMYGPTETTIWSSVFKVTDAEKIQIGLPIANTRFYILNDEYKNVSFDEEGELFIAGDCVSKGYYDNEELNRKKFIKSICGEERAYATGDVVKINKEEEILFCGRKDTQVKIRGYRIELGEIERRLEELNEIDTAIVVIRNGSMENKMITAFLKVNNDIEDIEISRKIEKWLPRYMIPVKYIRVSDFPKTLNQKYDRRVLEIMDIDDIIDKYSVNKEKNNNLGNDILKTSIQNYIEKAINHKTTVDCSLNIAEYGYDSIMFTDLADYINSISDCNIDPTFFYKFNTIDTIVDELNKNSESNENYTDLEISEKENNDDIAIVGMSGRFPQSDNLSEFWDNLKEGRDLISEIPRDRWNWEEIYDDSNSKFGGFIKDIKYFDAAFFGISPREAKLMDPQQKLILQSIWETIEDSGHKMSELKGSDMGVFIGTTGADYMGLSKKIDGYTLTGMAKCIIANRVSYLFDWHGPSEPIDTACSSSLVALHKAVQAIKNNDCSQAIVGGVNVILSPFTTIISNKLGMLNPNGKCMAFDESANGYVRSEGVGSVYLKKLNDAVRNHDHIYAVIKGSAVNHGGKATSLTAPNEKAQSDLIVKAIKRSGVDAGEISYIETHGTGTPLGDPIEINGIKDAFSQLSNQSKGFSICYLGSVKSNVGHLEAAAGIVSLIKVLLAINNKLLPGNINLTNINKYINLNNSHLELLRNNIQWEPKDIYGNNIKRIAGISSFGFGGVNAHVILEEYIDNTNHNGSCDDEYWIRISARGIQNLKEYEKNFADYIERHPNVKISDIAYTLEYGRENFEYSECFKVSNTVELIRMLRTASERNYIEEAGKYYSNDELEGYRISLPTYAFSKTEFWFKENCFYKYNAFIEDHIVRGNAIVPAAVQIENSLNQVSVKCGGNNNIIRDISFYKNIFYNNANEIMSSLDTAKKEITYKDSNTVYSQMTIEENKSLESTETILTEELKKGLLFYKNTEECYELFGKYGFDYKESLNVIDEIWFDSKTAISYISIPEKYWTEKFILHPAIIDGAFQTILVLLEDKNNIHKNNYYPYYIEKIQQYMPLQEKCIVYAKEIKSNEAIKKYDIYILNHKGILLVEIKGYVIKKAVEKEIIYLSEKIKETKRSYRKTMDQDTEVLIIDDNYDDEKINYNLKTGVYNVALCFRKGCDLKNIFTFLKSFSMVKNEMRIFILYCKKTVTEIERVYFMALKGMIRTLRIENPLIKVSIIELNEVIGSTDEVKELVLEELSYEYSDVVFYEENQRKTFDFVEIKEQDYKKMEINKDDVVFIAGYGKLAYLTAEYLQKKYSAKVILSGRHNYEEEQSEFRKKGLRYYKSDITNYESLKNVISNIIEEYGKIDVVINCAGIIEDSFILNKKWDSFERVLAPKVTGTINLDRVLEKIKLKYFIVYGSISGVVGNIGQVDYSYANSFIDYFVRYRNVLSKEGRRSGKAIAMNFSYWQNGGMEVDKQIQKRIFNTWGIEAIDNQTGMQMFDWILRNSIESAIPLYGNVRKIKNTFLKQYNKDGELK